MADTKNKKSGALEEEVDIPIMRVGYVNFLQLDEEVFPDKKFHWANATEPGFGVAMSQGWIPCKEGDYSKVLMIKSHPAIDGTPTDPNAYLVRRGMVLCWMHRSRWDAWKEQERREIDRREQDRNKWKEQAEKLGFKDTKDLISNYS